MELKELITALSEAAGPSGFETAARAVAAEALRPYVDEIKTDVLGNLIALRRAADPAAPTIMLEAHLDEIGLIVTGYDKGFLRFASLGGVDERMLPALEIKLLTEPPLYGVIDVLPPHILSAEEQDKPLDAKKLRIDVGLGEAEVKARVPQGTPAVFTTRAAALGEHRLCGKSLDDRSCVAIVIRAMALLREKKLGAQVAVLLSSQEEVGGRGAVVGAFSVAPQAAVAVDVTHGAAHDTPKEGAFPLGKGAVIGVGPNMTRRVSERLRALAEGKSIPYQTEVLGGDSGTDAWPIQISREGVATGLVSLPLRYMHTPVEVLDLRDAEACAQLLAAWVEDYGREAE